MDINITDKFLSCCYLNSTSKIIFIENKIKIEVFEYSTQSVYSLIKINLFSDIEDFIYWYSYVKYFCIPVIWPIEVYRDGKIVNDTKILDYKLIEKLHGKY